MTEPVASEIFDPYHKWLGIPPKDQPPHYYRLLAIDLFEEDLDVISAAADKQMAFIRSFQSGRNATLSQKILNEIAAARICLLDARKKAPYDAALRDRMVAATAKNVVKQIPVAAVPTPRRADEGIIVLADLAEADLQGLPPVGFAAHHDEAVRRRRFKSFIWSLAAVGLMTAACVMAVAFVMSRTPETHVAADRAGGQPGKTEHHGSAAAANSAGPSKSAAAASSSKNSAVAPTPTVPPQTAAPDAIANNSDPQPSHKNPLMIFPDIGKPASSDPPPEVHTEPPVTVPEPPKIKTAAELDKQLADAKTSDEYKAAAVDALRAAVHALDEHQHDVAKQFILKSLVAARKSGDSKLIIQATRAVSRPESAKEILAEKDSHDEGAP